MSKRERDKSPWTPAAFFMNGAVWALIGFVLINAGDIAVVGYVFVAVAVVQVLVGAIRLGTHAPTDSAG